MPTSNLHTWKWPRSQLKRWTTTWCLTNFWSVSLKVWFLHSMFLTTTSFPFLWSSGKLVNNVFAFDRLVAKKKEFRVSTRMRHRIALNQDRSLAKQREQIARKLYKIRQEEQKLAEQGINFKCILLMEWNAGSKCVSQSLPSMWRNYHFVHFNLVWKRIKIVLTISIYFKAIVKLAENWPAYVYSKKRGPSFTWKKADHFLASSIKSTSVAAVASATPMMLTKSLAEDIFGKQKL